MSPNIFKASSSRQVASTADSGRGSTCETVSEDDLLTELLVVDLGFAIHFFRCKGIKPYWQFLTWLLKITMLNIV